MTRTIPSTAPAVSRSEERAILTVTCSAAFLFFNSFGSIGVALPAIQKQFGNSLSEIQWVTLMGAVTISSLSFCFGRAGEILGQRRLYKIGVMLYAARAGLGAISTSFPELLLARAVMAVGLAMALPLSTALASPLAGRLADRFDAATMASIGLLTIVVGIACYSRLKTDSDYRLVLAALICVGAGIGIFTPANQTVAFAAVRQEDYGVLAAMLSSFGTAAGTIGTTIAVALMEIDGGQKLWTEPGIFAGAQQFAFACLLPIGIVALIVADKSRREKQSAA